MKAGEIHPDTGFPIIDMDADIANADWLKMTWDLPPYKSAEFLEVIGGIEQLESFRTLPVYQHAVDKGLIHDDEWVADSVPGWQGFEKAQNAAPSDSEQTASEQTEPLPKGKHIHIHLGE